MEKHTQQNSIQKMKIKEIFFKRKKVDFINNKLNMLQIHEQLSKLDLINTQMDFHATSLYPSAMWDIDSVYPKI